MSVRAKTRLQTGLTFGFLACAWVYAAWDHHSIAAGPPSKEPSTKEASIEVLFSPAGGCRDRIIEELRKAKKQVRVQVYMFTAKEIADAIIEAKKRGVDCEIIVERSQEKMAYGRLPVLKRAGVSILIDGEHETANNKIMLIDNRTIITGSYNYTKAAEEKNAENVLFIKGNTELFARYSANYDDHKAHSKAYQK